MKIKIPTYFLIALQLVATTVLGQQSITVSAEKSSILLGEPLVLSISITGGQPYKADIPDSLGPFEVLEKLPAKTSSRNGTVTSTEQIVVTSFDSGALRIPPIAVEGNPSIVSAGVDITVNTIPPDVKLQYGDIKQIIGPESPPQWPYIVAFLLLLVLSAYMLYRLNKKYRRVAAPEAVVTEQESVGSLVQQMERLKNAWEQEQLSSLQLGNGLMDIFKKYLAGKGISSRSKTGDELILATRGRYETGLWQEIVQTIRLCNAMRFGKFRAAREEGMEGINSFRKAITSYTAHKAYQPTDGRQKLAGEG